MDVSIALNLVSTLAIVAGLGFAGFQNRLAREQRKQRPANISEADWKP